MHALFWRVVYSVGIGYLLRRQSIDESWTNHFLKQGKTRQDAFEQWKRVYNFVMTITYVSFSFLAARLFKVPESFFSSEFVVSEYFCEELCLLRVLSVFICVYCVGMCVRIVCVFLFWLFVYHGLYPSSLFFPFSKFRFPLSFFFLF